MKKKNLLHIVWALVEFPMWVCVHLCSLCQCACVGECECCRCVCVRVFPRLHKRNVLLSLSSTAESPQAAGDKTSLVAHNNRCDHSEASRACRQLGSELINPEFRTEGEQLFNKILWVIKTETPLQTPRNIIALCLSICCEDEEEVSCNTRTERRGLQDAGWGTLSLHIHTCIHIYAHIHRYRDTKPHTDTRVNEWVSEWNDNPTPWPPQI